MPSFFIYETRCFLAFLKNPPLPPPSRPHTLCALQFLPRANARHFPSLPRQPSMEGGGGLCRACGVCVKRMSSLSLSHASTFFLRWGGHTPHRFLPTKLFVFFFENGETVGLQTVKSVTAQRCNKQSGLKSGEQQSPCLLVWRLDDEGDCCSSKTKKESHPSRSAKVLFFDAFRVTRQRDDG